MGFKHGDKVFYTTSRYPDRKQIGIYIGEHGAWAAVYSEVAGGGAMQSILIKNITPYVEPVGPVVHDYSPLGMWNRHKVWVAPSWRVDGWIVLKHSTPYGRLDYVTSPTNTEDAANWKNPTARFPSHALAMDIAVAYCKHLDGEAEDRARWLAKLEEPRSIKDDLLQRATRAVNAAPSAFPQSSCVEEQRASCSLENACYEEQRTATVRYATIKHHEVWDRFRIKVTFQVSTRTWACDTSNGVFSNLCYSEAMEKAIDTINMRAVDEKVGTVYKLEPEHVEPVLPCRQQLAEQHAIQLWPYEKGWYAFDHEDGSVLDRYGRSVGTGLASLSQFSEHTYPYAQTLHSARLAVLNRAITRADASCLIGS